MTLAGTQIARPPTNRQTVGARLVDTGPGLWRVLDDTGRVVGHMQAREGPEGTRFRAQRYQAATRTFRSLGDFWSADDAVDCLRLTR